MTTGTDKSDRLGYDQFLRMEQEVHDFKNHSNYYTSNYIHQQQMLNKNSAVFVTQQQKKYTGDKQGQKRVPAENTMMADFMDVKNGAVKKKKMGDGILVGEPDMWLHDKAQALDEPVANPNNTYARKDPYKNIQSESHTPTNKYEQTDGNTHFERRKKGKYYKQGVDSNRHWNDYNTQKEQYQEYQQNYKPRDSFNNQRNGGGMAKGGNRKVYMKQEEQQQQQLQQNESKNWKNKNNYQNQHSYQPVEQMNKNNQEIAYPNKPYRKKYKNRGVINEDESKEDRTPRNRKEMGVQNEPNREKEVKEEEYVDPNPVILIIDLETDKGTLKINIHQNDNTYEVAEKICADNNFSSDLIPAISLQINKALGLNPFHHHPITTPLLQQPAFANPGYYNMQPLYNTQISYALPQINLNNGYEQQQPQQHIDSRDHAPNNVLAQNTSNEENEEKKPATSDDSQETRKNRDVRYGYVQHEMNSVLTESKNRMSKGSLHSY